MTNYLAFIDKVNDIFNHNVVLYCRHYKLNHCAYESGTKKFILYYDFTDQRKKFWYRYNSTYLPGSVYVDLDSLIKLLWSELDEGTKEELLIIMLGAK